jgi:hypothetical protein
MKKFLVITIPLLVLLAVVGFAMVFKFKHDLSVSVADKGISVVPQIVIQPTVSNNKAVGFIHVSPTATQSPALGPDTPADSLSDNPAQASSSQSKNTTTVQSDDPDALEHDLNSLSQQY